MSIEKAELERVIDEEINAVLDGEYLQSADVRGDLRRALTDAVWPLWEKGGLERDRGVASMPTVTNVIAKEKEAERDALRAEVERLKVSMVNHFQREHLEGDGPEIDRWKRKVKRFQVTLAWALEVVAAYLDGLPINTVDNPKELRARSIAAQALLLPPEEL